MSHELFRAQAALTPDAVAVRDGRTCLLYRELEARASRLASALREACHEPRIGVACEGVAQVVGMLATWEAGGTYVPLDLELPDARLALLLDDATVSVVITDAPQRFAGRRCLTPSAEGAATAGAKLEGGDDSFVIYTSGSTGAPKGVVGLHRAVWRGRARPIPSSRAKSHVRECRSGSWTRSRSCSCHSLPAYPSWSSIATPGAICSAWSRSSRLRVSHGS